MTRVLVRARAARGVVILCMWRAAREAGADIDFRSQRSACADSSGYTSRSGQLSSVSAGSVQHETKQGVANNTSIDRRRSVRRPHWPCVSRGARRCGPSDCAAAASLLVPRTYKSRRHLTLDVRWPTCNKYPACPTRHLSVSTHGRSPRAGHHSRAPRHLRSRRGPSDHGLRPTRGRGTQDGPARRRCRRRSRRDPRSHRSPLLRSRP